MRSFSVCNSVRVAMAELSTRLNACAAALPSG